MGKRVTLQINQIVLLHHLLKLERDRLVLVEPDEGRNMEAVNKRLETVDELLIKLSQLYPDVLQVTLTWDLANRLFPRFHDAAMAAGDGDVIEDTETGQAWRVERKDYEP